MEEISLLVEGGKASAGPPLGPALGPLGINIGLVIAEINKKTEEFRGMRVPVTVFVDRTTKDFKIRIGVPPVSSLIKKELNLQKLASDQKLMIASLSLDQTIKIAKMKMDSLNTPQLKKAVKQILGTCHNMGVYVEGKHARTLQREIDEGKHDHVFCD